MFEVGKKYRNAFGKVVTCLSRLDEKRVVLEQEQGTAFVDSDKSRVYYNEIDTGPRILGYVNVWQDKSSSALYVGFFYKTKGAADIAAMSDPRLFACIEVREGDGLVEDTEICSS